jgi:hypothetical protein
MNHGTFGLPRIRKPIFGRIERPRAAAVSF